MKIYANPTIKLLSYRRRNFAQSNEYVLTLKMRNNASNIFKLLSALSQYSINLISNFRKRRLVNVGKRIDMWFRLSHVLVRMWLNEITLPFDVMELPLPESERGDPITIDGLVDENIPRDFVFYSKAHLRRLFNGF